MSFWLPLLTQTPRESGAFVLNNWNTGSRRVDF